MYFQASDPSESLARWDPSRPDRAPELAGISSWRASSRSLVQRSALPLTVLFTCTAMSEVVDIAAAGHIVGYEGPQPMLWLWAGDALVGLVGLSGVGLLVDRLGPRGLMGILALATGGLYAELPPARMFGDTARVTASWLEFPFLDLELTGLTQVDVPARPAPAAAPGGELRGQMHDKYMPRTGEWGKADASHAVITWRRCWPRAKGLCWPAVSSMRRRA